MERSQTGARSQPHTKSLASIEKTEGWIGIRVRNVIRNKIAIYFYDSQKTYYATTLKSSLTLLDGRANSTKQVEALEQLLAVVHRLPERLRQRSIERTRSPRAIRGVCRSFRVTRRISAKNRACREQTVREISFSATAICDAFTARITRSRRPGKRRRKTKSHMNDSPR